LTQPVKDQFYGDRSGSVEDPFGHHWYIATHLEDPSPEEVKRRMDAEMGQNAGAQV
jgi:PhnB protein